MKIDAFRSAADFYSRRADYPLNEIASRERKVVRSDARDCGKLSPLWAAVIGDCLLVSVRSQLVQPVEKFLNTLSCPKEIMTPLAGNELLSVCGRAFGEQKRFFCYSGVKLYCDQEIFIKITDPNVRKMTMANMPRIMELFYSFAKPDDKQCMEAVVAGDAAFAYFLGNEPVSFCTTHHKYMSDKIGDLCMQGTLVQYRGHGYGKATVSAATNEILKQGRTPVWGASIYNMASIKTAQAVGYRLFCQVLEIRSVQSKEQYPL